MTCSELFYKLQTDIPEIIAYGRDYVFFVCILSFGMFLQVAFDRMLQATGRTFYTMFTQGSGAIINIILDPILIFGWFGFPRMEVAGAALATVIGQIIAMIISAECDKEYGYSTEAESYAAGERGHRPDLFGWFAVYYYE